MRHHNIALAVVLCAVTQQNKSVAAPLVAISQFGNAGYTDLVRGADGMLHAVWQDMKPGMRAKGIFYSASRDGMRWSAPVNLADPQDVRNVTVVRVAVDGAGRVYAFWKLKGDGAQGIMEIDSGNTMGQTHGALRYRVLEKGRWSVIISVGRDNKLFSWFPSIDESGVLHVVWSENSDPEHQGVTVWPWEVNTIRHAQVNGPVVGDGRVVLHQPNTGFWGLSGYVDAQGKPRFIATRQNGTNTSNAYLVRFDGTAQSPLSGVPAVVNQSVTQLVRDSQGREHVIHLDSNARSVMATSIQRGAQPVRIYTLPQGGAGEIKGFQATRRGSAIVITIQAKERPETSVDLLVAYLNAGRWTTPVNVTNNANKTAIAGYIDTNASTINTVSQWNAAYASADARFPGELDLLLTNRSTVVATDSRAGLISRYTASAAWSFPRVYFTRIGGAISSSVHGPPASSTVHGPPEAAIPTAIQTSSRPTRMAEGLPAGEYLCHYNSQFAGEIPTGKKVRIVSGDRYVAPDGSSGSYQYDAASRKLSWASGLFATPGIVAEYIHDGDRKPVLKVTGVDKEVLRCVLR